MAPRMITPRRLGCAQCGKSFECGLNADCWCAAEPYRLPLWSNSQTSVDMGVPVGAWRSVDEYVTSFARESFIDECAHAAGIDPADYRRAHMAPDGRIHR